MQGSNDLTYTLLISDELGSTKQCVRHILLNNRKYKSLQTNIVQQFGKVTKMDGKNYVRPFWKK